MALSWSIRVTLNWEELARPLYARMTSHWMWHPGRGMSSGLAALETEATLGGAERCWLPAENAPSSQGKSFQEEVFRW